MDYGFTFRDISNNDALSQSVNDMRALLHRNRNNAPCMGTLYGTQNISKYSFEVGFHDVGNVPAVKLTFIDVPGEKFRTGNTEYQQILDEIKQCQILIVAVDVPALKASVRLAETERRFAMSDALNCTDSLVDAVQNLGTDADICGNNPSRLVIFVPVKCEWLLHSRDKQNEMNKLSAEIQDVYNDAICNISQIDKAKAIILPVETIGGFEYIRHSDLANMKIICFSSQSEQRGESRWCRDEREDERECSRCELQSRNIILPNGDYYGLKDGDDLMNVTDFGEPPFCYKPNEPIPYAWFQKKGEYKPCNCERIFFEVLKLTVQDCVSEGDYEINDFIEKWCSSRWRIRRLWDRFEARWIRHIRNAAQLQAMCQAVRRLKEEGKLVGDEDTICNRLDNLGSQLRLR
jgi:hypothetical protein